MEDEIKKEESILFSSDGFPHTVVRTNQVCCGFLSEKRQ